MPPALPFFTAALLLPFLPRPARRLVCVATPLLAWWPMYALPRGASWTAGFLGVRLVLARSDRLSLVFGLVFLAVALLANVYGWHRRRTGEQVAGLVYAGGGLAVVFAGDLLSMLIAWEIMAVASTFLIFARRRKTSLRAGQRYLMVHLSGGGVLLLGVLLILQSGQPMAFGSLKETGAGGWLILLALCLNAAVPPLHAWLPDAYPQASVSGSVFLSAFTTKAAVYCLIRGFPGVEVLMWAGAVMAVYGVVFAVMENDIRRLLAYHIVSQVGYMVCGVGIGTEMALNGATAHAFCHLIYKALLFMGTGAVLFTSGREKLTELGGLARAMPLTLLFYMVGALSIAGAPLFNGFISKSLVVAAAAEDGRGLVVWMLQIASVGTFLSVALKLPYFAWFGERPAGIHAREAPRHMLLAMGGASALCVLLGVVPGLLYSRLPFPPVDYRPYTAPHVFEMLLLMAFTGVGFRQLFARLVPHDTVTLDTDWFYRRPAAWFVSGFAAPLDASAARLGARFAQWRDRIGAASRNPPVAYARWRDRLQGTGDGEDEPVPWFDEDRQRVPVAVIVLWVLSVVGVLALFSLVP